MYSLENWMVISMKKSFKALVLSTATLVIFLFLLPQVFSLFLPEPTVIQAIQSPDGKYTAYIYESNGGATTGFIYHLSIIETGKRLPYGKGNAYSADSPVISIMWTSEQELYVENYRQRVYVQEELVKEIKVTYQHWNK